MEPAKIDWKNLEWNFTVDELYEHLNAPKFVDFLSLNHNTNNNNDDETWFCKPGELILNWVSQILHFSQLGLVHLLILLL